jgi:chitinase
MKTAHRSVAALLLSLGIGACAGEATLDPGVTGPPTVAAVNVALAAGSLVVGQTSQATAALTDASGNVLSGRVVTWTSSVTAVATIAGDGTVLAVAPGTSVITATSEGKTGSATITVGASPVAYVRVALGTSTLAVGGTTQATATAQDAGGGTLVGRSITWTSATPAVATVSQTGVVTAVSAGTSAITATSEGKSGSATVTVSAVAPPPPAGHWISGYWVGYQRDLYPETQVDFSLMTHFLLGAIQATPSGGVTTDFYLDPVTGPQVAKTLSTRAHQAGRKALLMLGGDGGSANILAASSPANINTFVGNLVSTMNTLGYDGIDVDWEPLNDQDKPTVITLLQKLRAAKPGIILTFPVGWVNANWGADPWYAQIAPLVDQINIMSYGMADNWGGWLSWHQAALYGEGGDHPSSIAASVNGYIAAGVPAAKLGIGLGFYGSCWQGTNAMLQPLGSSAGVVASDNDMSYTNIMQSYYTASAYHWDATARAGYLGFATKTGPMGCEMISYEDPQSIAEKGAYVKSAGVGGAIIWTINQGRLPNAPAGSQDPLLKAAYNSIVP